MKNAKPKAQAAKAPSAPFDSATVKLRAWQDTIRAHPFWQNVTSPRVVWEALTVAFAWIYALLLKLPWVAAVLVIGTIVVQGLAQQATVINPISVPKELADRGYTPEVAGLRLRDAMATYIAGVQTHMRRPDIALHGDVPNIVVPTVGISLDAVVSTFRTLLRSTRSRTLSGEIVTRDSKYWLRLRLDGREIHTSAVGVALDRPDDLFAAAVPDVLTEMKPYFVALALSQSDEKAAMTFVDTMIAKLPPGDEELPWIYNRRGLLFRHLKDSPAAAEALETAIRLNPKLTIAHANLASVYMDMHKIEESLAQDREALRLEPDYALVRSNYSDHLRMAGRLAEAKAEIDKALALNKSIAPGYETLGNIYRDTGQRDQAIAAYTRALRLNPKLDNARRELDKLAPPQASNNAAEQK